MIIQTHCRRINDFGVLRREQQRHKEAESLLRQALDGRQHKLGPDHPACFESMHELVLVYIAQKDYDRGRTSPARSLPRPPNARLGLKHQDTLESLKQLVTLYEVLEQTGRSREVARGAATEGDHRRVTRHYVLCSWNEG